MLDNECNIVNENFDNYEGLFNSGYCSLKLLDDFFTKLKSLGIYDKTKIIIVSDHGTTIQNGENFISTINFNVNPSASSALMLVKDFNQNADLMTSMQFLSNMDTYGFSLSGVSENKEIQKDVIKNPKANRSLIYIHKVSPNNSYNITEAYEVKNYMFDEKNWNIL